MPSVRPLRRELFLIAARAVEWSLFVALIVSAESCKVATAQVPPHALGPASLTENSPKHAQQPAKQRSSARPSGPIEFTDITTQAGIHFKHNSGAFGKKYLPV